jgi:hypothetical protein
MALHGTDPAYLSCRAGIERAGASRAGAYRYAVNISIKNADGSGVVVASGSILRPSLKVNQAINDTPAAARFTLKPSLTRAAITVGQLVQIAGEFGGHVLRVTKRYVLGVGVLAGQGPTPFLDIECTDYNRLLNRRLVTGHWSALSASTIAQLLLQRFTMGFSGAGITPNLPNIDDFPVTNETVTGALMRLAKLIDGDFYIDDQRIVHLFGQAGDMTAVAGTPPAPLVMPMHSLRSFTTVADDSQRRTRMVIEGKSTTVPVSTPSGATTVVVNATSPVDWLVESGGGGGGNGTNSGGGGGGGLLVGTDTIISGNYPVVVGAGGAAATQGQPSSFNGHAPPGGGAGANTGASGGSGGTGGGGSTPGTGGAGTAAIGYGGGAGAPASVAIEGLIVAGGGGGAGGTGAMGSGGGGGGALPFSNVAIVAGAYNVVVGGGGVGGDAPGNGANSSFDGMVAIGGGAGGLSSPSPPVKNGQPGGSGGGGSSGGFGGAGTAGQGFAGGNGDSQAASGAGGGGGAGQAGSPGNGPVGGAGGNGILWSGAWFAGGGGGNGQFGYGNGGSGGGGRGGAGGNPGVAGQPNSGGGGGGGTGYNGGSGIVYIRYVTGTLQATGGSIASGGGYTVHTFFGSGTFTVSNIGGGGGGGGTGGPGGAGAATGGGTGGPGVASAISGASVNYGGGGGGYLGSGGAGGGGYGNGTAGTANTGGGGGGASGPGGAGVVVLSYVSGTLNATGGTMTFVGGRTIHTFTANGTFAVASIVLTAPPPLVFDLPIDDATQLDPNGGYVRLGFSTYSYLGVGGPTIASGANPPGSNTSAAAAALATSISVDDARIFAAAPGWVKVGDQTVRYTATSNSAPGTLSGIPALGFGALNAAVTAATPVSWLSMIRLSATGISIAPPLGVGDPVVQVVIVDDPTAQAATAAVEGGDGVHEQGVQDGRLSVAGMNTRANAELIDFDHALTTATWDTVDMNAKAGRLQLVQIDGLNLSLMITNVDVDFSVPHVNPRRTCTGSTVRAAALLDAVVTSTN